MFLLFVAGCASTAQTQETRDAAIARESSAARSAFDEGEYSTAADLYRQARVRAEAIAAPREIISADVSIAVAMASANDDAQAKPYLTEAAYEASRVGSPRLPEIQLLRARMAYRMGQLDEAAQIASSLRSDAAASNMWRGRALAVLGKVACDRNQLDEARADLTDARQVLPNPDAVERADLSELEGKIDRISGKFVEAAAAFDQEADAARSAQQYDRMAGAMARAADALAAAGKKEEAADRYYHAALSASARDEGRLARQWLAIASANATSPQLRQLIEEASSQLSPTSAP